MQTFHDHTGREWQLELNLATAKQIRETTGYWLLDETDLRAITDDLAIMADVLYAACEQQAHARELDDYAFGVLLTDCFQVATDAWFKELAAFCRKLGRNALATLAERIQEATTKVDQRATQTIQGRKVGELIDQAMDEAERSLDASLKRFRGKT